jgi:transposase
MAPTPAGSPTCPLAALIGIDWADAHHDIALQVAGTTAVEQTRLLHTPNALAGWLAELAARFAGQPVGIALETSRGPLVHALLEVPFVVLYPVNPRSLQRFREAFTPSGAKDDAPDACLLLELLVKHRDLEALQRARPATVRRFCTAHHCRRAARIDAHLAAIATATPLTRDPAILAPSVLFVRLLVRQLRALGPSLAALDAALDAAIAAAFAAHAEAALFATLPGAGAALAPRLLVAFGTDRQRFPSAADLQQGAGIAPGTVRSGQSCHVHWRWSVSTFLRQTFHEFAHHSILHCPWARAFYHTQRAHGKSHHVAGRALAFKWIRILWRCWQDRTPYDDARYTRALAHRGSPLAALLPQTEAAA